MSESYKSIANRQWDEIPEPQVLPVGSYLLKSRGVNLKDMKVEDEDGEEKAVTLVNFGYGVVEPMSDVSEEDLAKLGEDYDYAVNKVYATFWINDDGDWNKVRKHLTKHGIDTKGMSLPESFKAIRNKTVVAYLDERTYTNNKGDEVTENTPTNFVPAE